MKTIIQKLKDIGKNRLMLLKKVNLYIIFFLYYTINFINHVTSI